MIELKGNSLPKRQKELNAKVKETVLQKIDFSEIKVLEEKSDVDKLFKIDVASEYKELTYIMETFKSGDSLYISRALKSEWLFDNQYEYIINPEYLHNNIFPFMSVKMKKKLLTTVSIHLRNEERALDFYNYCIKNKYINIAFKFLSFTSEEYKLSYLRSHTDINASIDIAHFIGNSFQLLEVYLQRQQNKKNYNFTGVLHKKLRHLYSVCSDRYLDLFETHCDTSCRDEFGLRISKDILTKHKQRVLKLPQLYIWHLNTKIISKHMSVEDAKLCFQNLMPCHAREFWVMITGSRLKALSVLNILPDNTVFEFLKKVYTEKYPKELFENGEKFYRHKIYLLMTPEQREVWAVNHLKDNIDVLGKDEEHVWCKYVNFQLAFQEIKKYISITSNHQKRTEMLKFLIDAANTEEELEIAINYYYDRHVNEKDHDKIDFIEKIYDDFNVFRFELSCWTAFDKILYSLKVYKKDFYLDQFRTLSIIYHIIKNKDVPETLEAEAISETRLHYFKGHQKKLTDDENKILYQYYINLFTSKLQSFEGQTYDKEIKSIIRPIATSFIRILKHFNKTKEDCPEILMKYTNLDWNHYKKFKFLANEDEKINEDTLIRELKQDSSKLIEKLPNIEKELSCSLTMQLNRLMKKIKIYFSNDIALQILNVFENWLKDSKSISHRSYNSTICSIFQIADNDYKVKMMKKYAPRSPKIAHNKIVDKTLRIQECICRSVQYSRPPVPLKEVFKYLKGDYVRYCLPLFNNYVMNLPRPLALKFVAATLDTPVSVQKHGLRLAFKCFNAEELKTLLLDVWTKTKNVSLRKIIYKGLFERIIENEDEAEGLYEILKEITLDLNENDDDEIYDQFRKVTSLPAPKQGHFLQLIWIAVEKLSHKKLKSFDRKALVVRIIKSSLHIFDREFCRTQILDKFLKEIMFDETMQAHNKTHEVNNFSDEMWNLVAKYIVSPNSTEQIDRSLDLANSLISQGIKSWDFGFEGRYVVREFLTSFIYKIINEYSLNEDICQGSPVLEFIIKQLEDSLPISQTYLLYCELNLTVYSKEIMEKKMAVTTTGEISYHRIKCEEVAARYSDKVLKFLTDLKKRGILFPTFYNALAKIITDVILSLVQNTTLNRNHLLILLCGLLIDTQMSEAVILSTLLLPTEVEVLNKIYLTEVVDKIEKIDSEEIQAIMHTKVMRNFYLLGPSERVPLGDIVC